MLINGIFEGGGIKGLAYVGVMRFLEERGFRFFQVGGTSVGSIFASLIAAGYNSHEIERLIDEFDVDLLTPINSSKNIIRLFKVIKNKGVYQISDFERYLFEVLKKKGKVFFHDVKFGDRYLLKMITTELSTKRMVVIPDDLKDFNYNSDRFLIARAVAMSANIPFFYCPYKIGNFSFVDGGVTNNFPINLFEGSNVPTVGFKLGIDEKSSSIITKYQKKIFNLKDEYNLADYNIINIDTLGIKATDFKKGLEMKYELYNSGYQSVRRFFYNSIR